MWIILPEILLTFCKVFLGMTLPTDSHLKMPSGTRSLPGITTVGFREKIDFFFAGIWTLVWIDFFFAGIWMLVWIDLYDNGLLKSKCWPRFSELLFFSWFCMSLCKSPIVRSVLLDQVLYHKI